MKIDKNRFSYLHSIWKNENNFHFLKKLWKLYDNIMKQEGETYTYIYILSTIIILYDNIMKQYQK